MSSGAEKIAPYDVISIMSVKPWRLYNICLTICLQCIILYTRNVESDCVDFERCGHFLSREGLMKRCYMSALCMQTILQ